MNLPEQRSYNEVKFLTAIARHPFHEDGIGTPVDGKIDMFPFVDDIPAQFASRNCPCGAIATAPYIVTKKNKYD